ncbi:hypothetical protein FRC02_000216 [Tulasnella sp. 418]|nr:hypothetical protein FRC02_000216 [Tulasnella sp. 418]
MPLNRNRRGAIDYTTYLEKHDASDFGEIISKDTQTHFEELERAHREFEYGDFMSMATQQLTVSDKRRNQPATPQQSNTSGYSAPAMVFQPQPILPDTIRISRCFRDLFKAQHQGSQVQACSRTREAPRVEPMEILVPIRLSRFFRHLFKTQYYNKQVLQEPQVHAGPSNREVPVAPDTSNGNGEEFPPREFTQEQYTMDDLTRIIQRLYLFPTNEDPEGTPITIEEAREIARTYLRPAHR